MRRLLTFAAFLLILLTPVCILPVPVCAQRGGHGGGGSAGHGGFSGGHASGGGHSFGGGAVGGSHLGSSRGATHLAPRAGSYRGAGSRVLYGRSFSGRSGYGRPGYGRSGGTRFSIRTRPGFGSRYPYYGYYGYYDPYWWSEAGSSSDQDAADQRQLADQMNEENLEQQQALEGQDQDAYAPPRGPRAEPAREEARNEPQTVLVFRDQHQREIQNYAIADGLIWNFTAARTEKIPLAVIDIPATIRANDDRGVDFRLPIDGEGQ